jgi:SAM-dependent methyltransferase
MDNKKLYQKIYDNFKEYGSLKVGKCPGARYFTFYKKYLKSPILDLGCGRGDTVFLLRQNGFDADGIDIIELNNGMYVGDITDELSFKKQYKTIMCMDVIEHIEDKYTNNIFNNFKKAETQIFTIHNGSSTKYYGKELHINRKPFKEWEKVIRQNFIMIQKIQLHKKRMLYITQTKG